MPPWIPDSPGVSRSGTPLDHRLHDPVQDFSLREGLDSGAGVGNLDGDSQVSRSQSKATCPESWGTRPESRGIRPESRGTDATSRRDTVSTPLIVISSSRERGSASSRPTTRDHNSEPVVHAVRKSFRKLPKGANQNDYFRRISSVVGKIISAKSLPFTGRKPNPFCLVKAIRSNLFLNQVTSTPICKKTTAPKWEHGFQFDVPYSWGLIEMVGLKFLVFSAPTSTGIASPLGTNDFLGGIDLDISDLRNGTFTTHELELGGNTQLKQKSSFIGKTRRPSIYVEVTIFRDWVLRPQPLADQLLQHMKTYKRVCDLYIRVQEASHLPRLTYDSKQRDGDGREIACVISVLFCSGEVQEVTRFVDFADDSYPTMWTTWSQSMTERFPMSPSKRGRDPIVVMFDVFDVTLLHDKDGKRANEHLGSAVIELHGLDWDRTRMKLLLSQPLVSKRLDAHGKTRRTRVYKDFNSLEAKPERSFQLGLRNLGRRLRRSFDAADKDPPMIQVEVGARWDSRPMPHSSLVTEPVFVKNGEDAYTARTDWESSGSMFRTPAMLNNRFFDVPHVIRADTRIVLVYGIVHGASELIAADVLGKSDPYCIVEAISKHNDRMFVHRTKVIKECLCPAWDEHFHMQVPEDFELQFLKFNVYDSDQGSLLSRFGDGDDHIGHATIDLSYEENGERIVGEVPLIGARKATGTAAGHFRRSSRIIVEVLIERRVYPIFEPTGGQGAMLQTKHTLSRVPESRRAYTDPSQEVVKGEPKTAAKLLAIRSSGALGSWTHSAKPTSDEDAFMIPQLPELRKRKKVSVDDDDEDDAMDANLPGEPDDEEYDEDMYDLSGIGRRGWLGRARRTESMPNIYVPPSMRKYAPGVGTAYLEKRVNSEQKLPCFKSAPISYQMHTDVLRLLPDIKSMGVAAY